VGVGANDTEDLLLSRKDDEEKIHEADEEAESEGFVHGGFLRIGWRCKGAV